MKIFIKDKGNKTSTDKKIMKEIDIMKNLDIPVKNTRKTHMKNRGIKECQMKI